MGGETLLSDWALLGYALNHYYTATLNFNHIAPLSTMISITKIMLGHCHGQNIHSHIQNRCFKKMTKFRPKKVPTKRPFAWGVGVGGLHCYLAEF